MTAEPHISPGASNGFFYCERHFHEEEPKLVLPSANLDSSRTAKSSEEQQGDSVIPAPPALSDGDITRLSLQRDTESLQIQRLQLELQLAQLKLGSDPTPLRQSAK
ncbi:hypothetical protein OS493_031569 [Desmophyllum pertusum]|uniref:Uncharacterized protein n=1 Tax=Desmophyllum pertusum TaxID=174260 RepID=A0A9W9YW37_9CNID|nr:hypothetical protein OS493_031569 [Desmophyllum pertusum]